MLEKKVTFDQTITENGIIQVRQITRILEDGKELSKSYHRSIVNPKDDVTDKDDRTKLIASAIYTPEFIVEYDAKIEAEKIVEEPIEPIEKEK